MSQPEGPENLSETDVFETEVLDTTGMSLAQMAASPEVAKAIGALLDDVEGESTDPIICLGPTTEPPEAT